MAGFLRVASEPTRARDHTSTRPLNRTETFSTGYGICRSPVGRGADLVGQAGKQSAMFPSQVTMPLWHEKHLRAATRAAGVALWSWNVDTDAITMDEPAYDLWEVPKGEQNITFEILSKNIHPADLERVRSAFAATRAVVGSYEIDFVFSPEAISAGFPLGARATMPTSQIEPCSVFSWT
jgi:hypothetical protein